MALAVRCKLCLDNITRRFLLQQLTDAVSVIIVCCKILARLTGPVRRTSTIAYVGLYRLVQQTQVLQGGHLTPYGHMSQYANTCTSNPSKHWPFNWVWREIDREIAPETDREIFAFAFGFVRFKPTDVLGKNRKTDRATFHFRFTTLYHVPLLWTVRLFTYHKSSYGKCYLVLILPVLVVQIICDRTASEFDRDLSAVWNVNVYVQHVVHLQLAERSLIPVSNVIT